MKLSSLQIYQSTDIYFIYSIHVHSHNFALNADLFFFYHYTFVRSRSVIFSPFISIPFSLSKLITNVCND